MSDPTEIQTLNYQARGSGLKVVSGWKVAGAVIGSGVVCVVGLGVMVGGMILVVGALTGEPVRREPGIGGMMLAIATALIGQLAVVAGFGAIMWVSKWAIRAMQMWAQGERSFDAHAEGWK